MIYTIKGTLTEKNPTFVVIEANGVGYGLHISLATYERLKEVGAEASLLTYLHVREDALQLFGFSENQERELFLALISVSGIGPRLAVSVLSGISVNDLCTHIRNKDAAKITKVPGVGKKTAERLILELQAKVDKIGISANVETNTFSGIPFMEEAVLALQSLGYKPSDARSSVEKIKDRIPEKASVEDVIKIALQRLM